MSRLRVLYVDDEPDIRDVAVISLRLDPDMEVRSAESGAAALALLEDNAWVPDVVLLDVMMPGMDGPHTLSRLRAQSRLASTPIIFMTARVQAAERSRFLELGALAVISKPFDPMSLAKEVRAIFGASAAP